MAINQTIATFTNTFIARDGQRDNLFRVLALNTKALSLAESDMVYIKTAVLPGRKNGGGVFKQYGLDFNYQTSSVQFDNAGDYSLTFLFDANHELRTKFEQASRLIFNEQTTTGNWRVPTLQDIMTISPLDNQLNPNAYYHFYGVGFKGMDAVNFNMGGDGQMVEITAHLTYYFYKGPGSDTVYAGE